MTTVMFSEVGEAKKAPTMMDIVCTFRSKSFEDEEASVSLVELSEIVSKFISVAEEECYSLFSKNCKITTDNIRTSAVYNMVEVQKENRKVKEKVFSHYESVQNVKIHTDLNKSVLVALLGRVIDNPNLVSYNYSFSLSEDGMKKLNDEAIKDAYSKAVRKCELVKKLTGSSSYSIVNMDFSGKGSYFGDRACKSASFDSSLSNKDILLIEDNIVVPDVTDCVNLAFTAEFDIKGYCL